MNKKLLIFLVAAVVLAATIIWLANQQPVLAKSQRAKFQLPANAVRVNDDLYSLGKSFDRGSGKEVEGFAIIHRKNEAVKPSGAKTAPTTCYGFLASGAKWKGTPESWIVNPANTRGLDPTFIFNNLTADIAKWESAAAYNILGDGAPTDLVLVADTQLTDGKNEVYFADLSNPSTIAVTIIWGIFGGPTFQRRLVEWDQVYDDVTFDWSASGELSKMDFENIATHELGHSVGMADLYNSKCAEETMYGYASNGEIKKRSLNPGDILGINKLY